MLWAWERPEDLRFLDTDRVGVAFLAGTVTLSGSDVRVRPRMQPLRVPPGTSLIAVVRIETDPRRPSALAPRQVGAVAQAIAKLTDDSAAGGVQIDFDARRSERTAYRSLIATLRARIPTGTPLSITALASWCAGDAWVRDLPIEEAVPMLFRMGADDDAVRGRLLEGRDFTCDTCRRSVGVSLDEPWPHLSPRRRIFAFNPQPWSREAVARLLREVRP